MPGFDPLSAEMKWRITMRLDLQETFYHRADNTFSSGLFASQLSRFVSSFEKWPGKRPLLFLCIGSDRVTGDSLGPVIGYKLGKVWGQEIPIIGSLDHPVHAVNLEQTLEWINSRKDKPILVAIVASVGVEEHVGCITLSNRPLKPGLAVNKDLPAVGHISITGIVSSRQSDPMFPLHSTSLALVMNLADCICNGISRFCYIRR